MKVPPYDPQALRQTKILKARLRKPVEGANSTDTGFSSKIENLQHQINLAMNAENYLPPNPGNAVDLIKQLNALAPGDPFGRGKLDQILQHSKTQLMRKIQSRDMEGAHVIIRQLQPYFSDQAEFKNLRGTVEVEDSRLMESKASWLVKAESAMAAGRYISPPDDNVLSYSNQVLATDPQNPKALALKTESVNKAASQAKQYAESGRFEEARNVYKTLLQIAQKQGRGPRLQELSRELERLEFQAYPVIHDHTFGSCSGRLRFNGYVISYEPSGDSRDGFSQKLTDVSETSVGEKLKLHFKNKTYRFQTDLIGDKNENRAKLNEIRQQLTHLLDAVN
jgi:hypothetical protein